MTTKQDYETVRSCILPLKIMRENLTDDKEASKQTLDVAIGYLEQYLYELEQIQVFRGE